MHWRECERYDIRSNIVREKLGWDTLRCRREKQTSMVDKIIKGKIDNNLSDLFTISNRDCYNLRSNNRLLSLPKPNLNALKRSLSYMGARI